MQSDPDDDKQVVLGVLHDRLHLQGDSRFVTHEAGLALLRRGPEILPTIERVLDGHVVPALDAPPTNRVQLLGLEYVLGAYLLIGEQYDPDRVVAYLKNVSQTLLTEFLSAITIFFRPMPSGYNFAVPPGALLIDYLKELARSDQDGVGSLAQDALQVVIQ